MPMKSRMSAGFFTDLTSLNAYSSCHDAVIFTVKISSCSHFLFVPSDGEPNVRVFHFSCFPSVWEPIIQVRVVEIRQLCFKTGVCYATYKPCKILQSLFFRFLRSLEGCSAKRRMSGMLFFNVQSGSLPFP